jgi:hypothetical protein
MLLYLPILVPWYIIEIEEVEEDEKDEEEKRTLFSSIRVTSRIKSDFLLR